MLLATLFCLAAACPQGQNNPRVVINEFQYDDNGADDYEFIELYNRTAVPLDIGGWRIEATEFDGASQTPILYATWTIPSGTLIASGGFYVLGAVLVPNVNQVIGNAVIRDENGILVLKDAVGTIEDTVFKESNKGVWLGAPIESPGLWGNHRSGREDQLFSSWSRREDGSDTNNNGLDFINTTATPGTTNNRLSILPFTDNFDVFTPGFPLAEWGGSFKEGRVIDPTAAANFNPNAIPASPQGGNAAIFWDDLGGGNSNQLLSAIGDNYMVEAWVYFDATPHPAAEYEAWSLGAQGTCDSFYNLPDPERLFGFTANGNTGVSWTLMRTSTGAALYFVDHNDGGDDWVTIGRIPIVAGVNDGWQRLRLQVTGNFAEGRFGGTFGNADGTVFGARVRGNASGVYIGYREFIVNNGNARPFTCDNLVIRDGIARVEYFGAGAATTIGTPALVPAGFPLINNPSYRLDFSQLVPNSLSVLVLSGTRQIPPVPLSLFGGPPTTQLLVSPTVQISLFANAQGRLSINTPVPNVGTLVGSGLAVQLLNVDVGLPFTLPIGHTDGCDLRFGF